MRNSIHSVGAATAFAATAGDTACRSVAVALAPDIRRLGLQDESELCRILLSLESSSRCSRFGLCVSDTYLAGYAQSALADADWIAGAFIDDRLRGVVEVHNDRPHGSAEAAFVVEQEWRRRGLGWTLLRAAMRNAAADAETNTLRMIFSRHNWPMRKLASKASGRLDMVFDEISVDVALSEIGRRSRRTRQRSNWRSTDRLLYKQQG